MARQITLAVLVLVATLLSANKAQAVESLIWSAQTGGSDLFVTSHTTVVGGISVTTTATQSGGPWDVAPDAFRSAGIEMYLDAPSGSGEPWVEIRFSFSRPVTNLAFTMFDFDGGPSGNWNDRATINAIPAQTPLTPAVGSAVSWNSATRTAQAISNASLSDSTGDIGFRFPQPVTSVSVRYIAGTTAGLDRLSQYIQIGNLTWDSGVVRVRKTTVAGVGGVFSFAQTNLLTTPAGITTTAANTATPASPTAHEINAPGGNVTLIETPAAGWLATGASCSDANSANTGNTGSVGSVVGSTVTLGANLLVLSGADITCTFTNTRAPQLRLQKSLPNGRVAAADQFTLNMTGMASLTTTGTGSTATGVLVHSGAAAGTTYTLSESAAGATNLAAYTTTYSCTNALPGGQTPSGVGLSFNLTPVMGDDLTCTFSNAAVPVADLAILKTGSAASVAPGGVMSFTLTASNNGPGAANGAVIRDVPGPGLDCSTPSPTASCSASGGAACPGTTVSVADLLGPAGVTIPVLSAGGSVAITLQCLVTATGLP